MNTDNLNDSKRPDFTYSIELDNDLPHSLRRSIWLIEDEEDKNTYTADELLDNLPQDIIFGMRASLYAAYKSNKNKYVCKVCHQPLGLRIRTNEGDFFPFFSHYQNSDDCPLKSQPDADPTKSIAVASKEEAFKASILYQDMLTKLKEILILSQQFSGTEINKIVSTPEIKGYRRPAIYTKYNNRKSVCFDLLVSSPLLSILVGRNAFYKMHKMLYLWVFPSFSKRHQSICQKDILYMNRRNVFVFDSKEFYTDENEPLIGHSDNNPSHKFAYEESIRQKRLLLNCYWQTPIIQEKNGEKIVSVRWNGPELVPFDQLYIDEEQNEIFYHDSDVDFFKTYSPDIQILINEWLRVKKDRWQQIFDGIEKRKLQYAQMMLRRERADRLKYYYRLLEEGSVDLTPFKDEKSGLYGYQIDNFTIIPPLYYEAKPFTFGSACVRKKSWWGIIDYKNNRLSDFRYSRISSLIPGFFCAIRYDKCFLMSYRGEIINGAFDSIEPIGCGLFRVHNQYQYQKNYCESRYWKTVNTGYGLLNKDGRMLLSCTFDCIGPFINGKSEVVHGLETCNIDTEGNEEYVITQDQPHAFKSVIKGKYGIMDETGHIIVDPIYYKIGHFIDGLAMFSDAHSNGVISQRGEVVLQCKYESVIIYSNGFFAVKDNGMWGVMNARQKIIIPFEYDEISSIHEGVIYVRKGWRSGKFDLTGAEILEITDASSCLVYESTIRSLYGLMSLDKKPITPLVFEVKPHFINGLAITMKDGQMGLIDPLGAEHIPFKYESLSRATGNRYIAKDIKGKFGILDCNGKPILDFLYNDITQVDAGLFKVKMNTKWGVLNESLNIIIPYEYDNITQIKNGVAQVRCKNNHGEVGLDGNEIFQLSEYNTCIVYYSSLKRKSGLMNKTHEPITSLIFDSVGTFVNGRAIAKKDNRLGVISATGLEIIPFSYTQLIPLRSGRYIARNLAMRYGIIDSKGKIAFEFIYSEIQVLNNSYIKVRNGMLCSVLDSHLNTVIEPFNGRVLRLQNNNAYIEKGGYTVIIPLKDKTEKIYLSKLEMNKTYKAVSTGYIVRKGVFIHIKGIGNGLIPSKYLASINKNPRDYKRGKHIDVRVKHINKESKLATFIINNE